MTSIQIPVPIYKSFLDKGSKVIVGQLTAHERRVEMEDLGDDDAPLAVSWSDEEFENFIRRDAAGRFWRRISHPLYFHNVSIARLWKDDLFDFRHLCAKLGGIHSDLNAEQPVDHTPRWKLPAPSPEDKTLQDRDPSLSFQNEVIDTHMAGFRYIAYEIYESVPEPVAIVRHSNPTPIIEIIDRNCTFEDIVMVYSLRDWDQAEDLINRLGNREFRYAVEFTLDTLDRTAFGPPDVRYQQAAFLREFESSYAQHFFAEKQGAAGILASFDDDDKTWLSMCADCLLGLEGGCLHPTGVEAAARAFLSGEIGSGLKSLTALWPQFAVVTDALRTQIDTAAGA